MKLSALSLTRLALTIVASTLPLAIVSLVPAASAALAETRTSPQATQHALDELANCHAQRRPECPTATATATLPTLAPPVTATLPPTSTPAPTEIGQSPTDPPLPLPMLGQATSGYVRPSPSNPNDRWLELAVPQGRWAVLYDTLCKAPTPWTNVWLALDEQSNRPITADRDDKALCAVSQWSWSSAVPCAEDELGVCDIERDGAYWDALAQADPAVAPTGTPTVVPTLEPQPPAQSLSALSAPQIVVRTIVVVATAAPSPTPPPTPTQRHQSTATPMRTATSVPTSTARATPTTPPSSTVTTSAIAALPTPPPTAAPVAPQQVAAWDWTLPFGILAAVALAVGVVWLVTRRRLALW